MSTLNELKEFNFGEAEVFLWTFKVQSPAGEDPKYTGRWVETSNEVDSTLKNIASGKIASVEETHEYSLLAENNQQSVLTIPHIETHAGLLIEAVAEQNDDKKIENVKHLRNAEFYLMKFVSGDSILLAIKKTDSGWKTRRAVNVRSVIFADHQLDVDNRPHFEISTQVDFFVYGKTIFSLEKSKFESVLRYKQAHREDFETLQADEDFSGIFADMGPLVDYIGENKIQLRRASAIKQKGHYKDEQFMVRLRELGPAYRLNIDFDDEGKIVATPESASDIITALLDHRLGSGFSEAIYDVQATKAVGG